MSLSNMRPARPANVIVAILYGAVVSLVLAYGIAYVFTHADMGVIAGLDGSPTWGPAILHRTALNLYAMQHVMLVGAGDITTDFGTTESITAAIAVPLSIWAFVPAIGLIIGGYSAAQMRRSAGRWGAITPALLGGMLYGVVFAIVAPLVKTRIGWFLLATVGGISSDPPMVPFSPDPVNALLYCTGFGLTFSYLGALLVARGDSRERRRGKWWACMKAVILVAVLVQIVFAVGALIWALRGTQADDVRESDPDTIIQLLPAVTGSGYGLLYGANMVAEMRTPSATLPIFEMNLYDGVRSRGGEPRELRPYTKAIAAGFIVLSMLLAGWIATRWGSRDGAIPTAVRILLLHSIYLIVIVYLSNQILQLSDPTSTSTAFIGLAYDPNMVRTGLGALILSFFGAYAASKRFSSSRESYLSS